jgi:hypothetical protein
VEYQGLIPTDWYPVGVQVSRATGKIVVTNDKGIGSRGAPSTISEGPGTSPATGRNTYACSRPLITCGRPRSPDHRSGPVAPQGFPPAAGRPRSHPARVPVALRSRLPKRRGGVLGGTAGGRRTRTAATTTAAGSTSNASSTGR